MSSDYLFDLIQHNNITELQNVINSSNVNTTNWINETLLMYAISLGNYDIVNLLLENNADTTTLKDDSNYTALDYAVRLSIQTNNKDILELLTNNNLNIKCEHITSSIFFIKYNQKIYKEIYSLFLS